MIKSKTRMIYALISVILLITEIFIALYVDDEFIRPYIGDVIVVILIGTVIRTIFPKKPLLLPVYIFIFACFTEFLQYIHITEILGVNKNSFLGVLIGSVYDRSDILSYGIGCTLFGICELIKTKLYGNVN